MSGAVIDIEHLSKRHRLGTRPGRFGYRTLRDALAEIGRARVRRAAGAGTARGERFIWALKDVSLTVATGEVVGIIGPNGAGKTTLLKVLSRITEPTEGRARIRGRVGPLLEVGTGFHPELTGRENVFLSGAIMGMRRAETQRKFDAIVEFAGVEPFIDTPVKHYSSGMYVRLAFAVAAHLEPEILLIDEILAVGDAAFQEKCLGKMSQVARAGRTVLFVSHNMAAVRSLCTRAVLLQGGSVQCEGAADDVVDAYLAGLRGTSGTGPADLLQRADRGGDGGVRAVSFEARDCRAVGGVVRSGAEVEFVVGYAASDRQRLQRLFVGLTIVDGHGAIVFSCTTSMTQSSKFFEAVPPSGRVVCRVKYLPLTPGRYTVNLQLKDGPQSVTDHVAGAAHFNVYDGGDSGLLRFPTQGMGSVVVPHEWELLPEERAGLPAGGTGERNGDTT